MANSTHENPFEPPPIRAELVRQPALPIIRRTFRYCLFFAVLFFAVGFLFFTPLDPIITLWIHLACVLGGIFYLGLGLWQLVNR